VTLTPLKKVGFLGGTFDPVHFGHIHLAMEMMERHALCEVVFCPASVSPFKIASPPAASSWQRRDMLGLALEELPCFSVWSGELEQSMQKGSQGGGPIPSFTIDSLRRLQKERREVQWYLIMGEDALHDLHDWKEVDELLHIAPPLIGSRSLLTNSLNNMSFSLQTIIREGWTPIPMMDISSTMVRQRCSSKKYCGHLLPHPVLEYITRHRLYEICCASERSTISESWRGLTE
jgi:nicotinate-nucleotide adenylyltransferase